MRGMNGLDTGTPRRAPQWEVLPDCPAPSIHNTLRAARGSGIGHSPDRKCICPHALALFAKDLRRRDAMRASAKVAREALTRGSTGAILVWLQPLPIENRPPDFSGGACTTSEGMKIADGGMNDTASLKGIAERRAAKEQCDSCPLLDTCRSWVTAEEKPAGSWGGVWGGMDPWNRRGLELVIQDGKAGVTSYVNA